MGSINLGGDWQTGGCVVVIVAFPLGLLGMIAAWRIGTVVL